MGASSPSLVDGNLRLCLRRCRVYLGKSELRLTATEYNLLAVLLQRKDSTLSRQELLQQVWGTHYSGSARTVDTHIQRLRKKLGRARGRLHTVWGKGYRWNSRAR